MQSQQLSLCYETPNLIQSKITAGLFSITAVNQYILEYRIAVAMETFAIVIVT